MGMTQMNVRIDEDLKAAGDAAFRAAGVTPSEVVRSVWEYAASGGEGAGKVIDLTSAGDGGDERRRALIAAYKKSEGLYARLYQRSVVDAAVADQHASWDDEALERERLNYEEMRWEAYLDKAEERGWDL